MTTLRTDAVKKWIKEQLWLHESWARSGPGCRGFWSKDPEREKKDLEEIRDWLKSETQKDETP